ncbi:MAG: hypothetical protein KME14_05935 [Tildeniella torsiva UHER 1998/13D]|nr:hypothetical protein [Tildeniella torsiva UHER 1998/13D]
MNNQGWTTEQLLQMSNALGDGYMPGISGAKAASSDRWTAQRHIQASVMRSQAYL